MKNLAVNSVIQDRKRLSVQTQNKKASKFFRYGIGHRVLCAVGQTERVYQEQVRDRGVRGQGLLCGVLVHHVLLWPPKLPDVPGGGQS